MQSMISQTPQTEQKKMPTSAKVAILSSSVAMVALLVSPYREHVVGMRNKHDAQGVRIDYLASEAEKSLTALKAELTKLYGDSLANERLTNLVQEIVGRR